MQFNTYLFILAVLPITVIGYFLLNKVSIVASKLLIVAVSLYFYGMAGVTGLIWLIISILVNYIMVIIMKKSSRHKCVVLWGGIIFNVMLLYYFKYFNFSITAVSSLLSKEIEARSIILPIGISFFTFQQIAYLVESYKGKTDKNSMLDYILYVVYFPKITMGPLVNQEDLISQFNDGERKKLNIDNLTRGIRMFNIGLFKKVILADTFAKAVTWGFDNITVATSMDLFLVMIAYTFQIYFDFSGYSDMAIGVSSMFNIDLPMNFDSPYKACSIREFWRKWHISLTKFLTEYIYFPLGGSRKGMLTTCINTMIVFIISGIWHGANWTFILWGFIHGALQIFDRLTEKLRENVHPALKWMTTFLTVSFLWLLFRASSITEWLHAICNMVSFKNMAVNNSLIEQFVLPETGFLIGLTNTWKLSTNIRGFSMLLFYVVSIIICLGFENSYRRKYVNNIFTAVLSSVMLVFCLTCLGGESVFVYYNF